MILFRKITQELKTYFSSKIPEKPSLHFGFFTCLVQTRNKADIILSVLAFSNSKT